MHIYVGFILSHFTLHTFLPFSQEHDTLSFLVSIKDVVNSTGDSQNDNLVEVPVTVIVLDENDNAPQFEQVSQENS